MALELSDIIDPNIDESMGISVELLLTAMHEGTVLLKRRQYALEKAFLMLNSPKQVLATSLSKIDNFKKPISRQAELMAQTFVDGIVDADDG